MVEIVIHISSLLVLAGQIKIDFIPVHSQAAHRILWQVSDHKRLAREPSSRIKIINSGAVFVPGSILMAAVFNNK
jgi:hypothetical protein